MNEIFRLRPKPMLSVLSAAYTTAAAYTAAAAQQRTPPQSRTITDAIHHSIELHPLVALVVDSTEFQRLRGIHQLGSCHYVFPSAVHDRFQHSLGVSHLSREWAEHFQRLQQIRSKHVFDIQIYLQKYW